MFKDKVEEFINGEINFISDEIARGCDPMDFVDDLHRLKNLDTDEIAQKVYDDMELQSYINETIHYYIYH